MYCYCILLCLLNMWQYTVELAVCTSSVDVAVNQHRHGLMWPQRCIKRLSRVVPFSNSDECDGQMRGSLWLAYRCCCKCWCHSQVRHLCQLHAVLRWWQSAAVVSSRNDHAMIVAACHVCWEIQGTAGRGKCCDQGSKRPVQRGTVSSTAVLQTSACDPERRLTCFIVYTIGITGYRRTCRCTQL